MTPKEKAVYLYLMFHQRTYYRDVFHTLDLLDKFHNNAKDCALIAIEEILDEIQPFELGYEYEAKIKFWNEVKNELEKL